MRVQIRVLQDDNPTALWLKGRLGRKQACPCEKDRLWRQDCFTLTCLACPPALDGEDMLRASLRSRLVAARWSRGITARTVRTQCSNLSSSSWWSWRLRVRISLAHVTVNPVGPTRQRGRESRRVMRAIIAAVLV